MPLVTEPPGTGPLGNADKGCGGVLGERVTRPVVALCAAIAAACAFAAPAGAHGFGQRYDLPLPLSLYLFGTAAAVVVSSLKCVAPIPSLPPARRLPGYNVSGGVPRKVRRRLCEILVFLVRTPR